LFKAQGVVHEFGWPKAIGLDSGPQFHGTSSRLFATAKVIIHELSSTRNPQSNGLAESGVKRVKYLIKKTCSAEEFQGALAAYRNTPMADGRDPPAVAFHRREMRDPDLPAFMPDASKPATESKGEEKKKRTFKEWKRCGSTIPDKRRWSDTGVIARPHSGHESYFVKKKGGRMVLKNQRHLRHRLGRQPPV
jgi:transposase InsO family protein